MKKIPFDVKYRQQIENKDYTVETVEGKPVEILKWDSKGLAPIIALVETKNGEEPIWYNENGQCFQCGKDDPYNLVIVTNESDAMDYFMDVLADFTYEIIENKKNPQKVKEDYVNRLLVAAKRVFRDNQDKNYDRYFDEWFCYAPPEKKTYRECFIEGMNYATIRNIKDN